MLYRSIGLAITLCTCFFPPSGNALQANAILKDGQFVGKQPETDLTVGNIVVGRSTLQEATKVIRTDKVKQVGDAGLAVRFLCARSKGGIEIYVESNLEMAWPKDTITFARVSRIAHSDVRCSTIDFDFSKVNVAGLQLGASSEQITSKKGPFSKRTPTSIVYAYIDELTTAKGQEATSSRLEIKFKEGKAIQFEITKMTEL